jgi:hypothetical protein
VKSGPDRLFPIFWRSGDRLGIRTKTVLLGSVAVCLTLSGCYRQYSPLRFIKDFAGWSAINCGRFDGYNPADAAINEAMDCALKAKSQGKAFFVIAEFGGIDSLGAEGLVSKGKGVVMRFSYDSAPCGGPDCDSSFNATPCATPGVRRERGIAQVTCDGTAP